MSATLSISGSQYTLVGTVKNRTDTKGIPGLNVQVFDKDLIGKDDFLDSTTTDASGNFLATFDKSDFGELFFDRHPDLYFIVIDHEKELLNSCDDPIKNAKESTEPIVLWVDDFDSNVPGAGKVPALGWKGGFLQANLPEFAYPNPDLSSLGDLKDNMANIKLLDRQQKVLWPEFSWLSEPGNADSRCYQMFAPDISRLGYTNDGRVYSIICPQQGFTSPTIGTLNVEVTVTGNRGWVDETTSPPSLYADMSVVGKIWFSPGAKQIPIVKRLWDKFANSKLPFPSDKDHAIEVITYNPKDRPNVVFPLKMGQTPPSEFPIPEFAKHAGEAWNVAHLDVEIGSPAPSGSRVVDKFNTLIMKIFNMISGNMLLDTNILSWNVWFIAPQPVNRVEWKTHALKWRKSIQADHGSPMGNGTDPKYFDGTDFKPMKSLLEEEEKMILEFEREHF